MALIGYARVSTNEQNIDSQIESLRAAGCVEVFEEFASGASRARPQLAAALARVRRGDTLLVARIDRLARSLAHLLAVVEGLRDQGVHFRSLSDPIDTSGPSGVLVLQMLGAVAEFERSLIVERTRAGLVVARSQGRIGGNPGLRARDPAALRKLAAARRDARVAALLPTLNCWLPVVLRMRPIHRWVDVVQAVNAILPQQQKSFTADRLQSTVRRLVKDGIVSPDILTPAQRGGTCENTKTIQSLKVVAALLRGNRTFSLSEIGNELVQFGIQPPRGGQKWAPSSVKSLIDRARDAGLITSTMVSGSHYPRL